MDHWRKYISTVVILIVCMCATNCNSEKLPISQDDLQSKVDEFVNELLRCRKFTSASVAIVHGNETLVSKGYGVVSLDTNATVTNKTLFGIASLSKALTSTLLGLILDKSPQGYTWDTPVRDILGEDFFFHDALRTTRASLRDLLTHRMGFPSNNNLRHQSGLDRETLAYKMRFLEPNKEFRSEFKYNNLMYGLLTHVTEVLGGDSWENLMKRHIFQPLGMTSSDFTHEIDLSRPDLVTTYQVDNNGDLRGISRQLHSFWGKLGGSGSILSNAEDMARWVKALLNHGMNEAGDQVIPAHIFTDTWTRYISIPVSSSESNFLQPKSPVSYSHFEYGLAWRIGFYRGWRTILHTGTSMGSLAQLTLIPDLNVGIQSSLSGDDPGHTGRRLLHIYVMDLLMGESPWLNVTSACEFPQTAKYRNEYSNNHEVQPNRRKKQSLDLYTGIYGDFAYGNVTVYANESTGELMMACGDWGVWTLNPQQEDHKFEAIGNEHVWVWTLDILFYHSESADPQGVFDKVDISSWAQYTRGLSMDQAPPPPELECDEPLTSNGLVYKPSFILYSIICSILICLIKV